MLNILVSVISYDIWFYISHLLLHKRFLYKYHKIHHANIEPTFLDTYVGHWTEGPFQGLGMAVPFTVMTYSWFDVLAVLLILNVRGLMRHDERCVFLIGNHHLLHHKYPNSNFGEYWIDSLCGTRCIADNEYKKGLIYI